MFSMKPASIKSIKISILLLFSISLSFWFEKSLAFTISEIEFELESDGFRLSIKDVPGMVAVAFHANRNRPFQTYTEGQFSMNINSPRKGRWSAKFNKVLTNSDSIYVWVSVQHGSVRYRHIIPKPFYVSEYREPPTVYETVPSKRPPVMQSPPPPSKTPPRVAPPMETACRPSITEVTGRSYCIGDLVFEENFDRYNSEIWDREIYVPTDEGDYEFVTFLSEPFVEDGVLVLKPDFWTRAQLSAYKRGQIFDLSRICQHYHRFQTQCEPTITPLDPISPIIVPKINTQKSFNFKYGKIEIRAKFPIGDWLIPHMTLEPTRQAYGTGPYASGLLRVAFARGNKDRLKFNRTRIDGSVLFAGAVLRPLVEMRFENLVSYRGYEHFGEQFHIYTMIWTPERISFEVDGEEYGVLTGDFKKYARESHGWSVKGGLAPFDQEFYLSLAITAAGFGDFPLDDDKKILWEHRGTTAKKQFLAAKSKWFPTWTDPSLKVDYIRVYAV